jgi:TRAP-type C4-dicarboxylate transport system substrate-binding protein
VAVIASSKFYEVQKHIVLSNHQYNPQSVVMSKKFWDSLSPAEKKIVDDAADEAAKTQREAGRAALAANLDILKKNGMQVTQFAPAEVAKLREKMKPVITQFTASVGEATVNEVMAELAKMRR